MDKVPERISFRDVDITNPAVMDCKVNRRRRCPVIVTIADAQITPVDIQKMLEKGMNVAKFKMSFSTKGDKIRLLGKVDKAAMSCCKKYGVNDWPVATCIELKTCVVKTGLLETEKEHITLNEGSKVILTCNISEYNKCNESKIFVDNYFITTDVKVGTEISIDCDEIILKCLQVIDDKRIMCIVTKSGNLSNVCSVCARSVKHTRPYLTKKDLEILRFALEYQVDMVVINYVRHIDTLKKTKQFMGKKLKRPLIISGICTQDGLNNFDDIMRESDGIILSREYLPYEIDASKRYRLSRIQKWIGAKCLQAGKPFYISGGVFQKALLCGVFDDIEISDVTNALLDGASGFILKDCFEIEFLLDVMDAMNLLCQSIEPLLTSKTDFWRIADEHEVPINAAEAAVLSCAAIANQTNALMVVIPTVTGKTVKALHMMRLSCIIITVSSNTRVTRLLYTYRSVVPLIYTGPQNIRWHDTVEARVNFAIEYAVKRGWAAYGDNFVTLERGTEASCYCDTVKTQKIAISRKALVECSGDEDGEEEEE